jgi:hypothetical protein
MYVQASQLQHETAINIVQIELGNGIIAFDSNGVAGANPSTYTE